MPLPKDKHKGDVMITSDETVLYTWAVRAVCDEMIERGFTVSISDSPLDEAVVMFKKYRDKMQDDPTEICYGLTGFPKPSDITKLKADKPFKFLHYKGIMFSKTVTREMNLSGVTDDEEGIKIRVKEWLNGLLS